MAGLFWVGLAVSAVAWFVGDWLAGLLFPNDAVSGFVVSFMFAVLAGGLAMMAIRMRGLRSGRYEKARWGVRRK